MDGRKQHELYPIYLTYIQTFQTKHYTWALAAIGSLFLSAKIFSSSVVISFLIHSFHRSGQKQSNEVERKSEIQTCITKQSLSQTKGN